MNNSSQIFNIKLMSDSNLIKRERELEEEAHIEAVNRVRRARQGGLDRTKVGQAKVYEVLSSVAGAIDVWVAEQATKKRKPEIFKYISAVDPSVLAFVAAKVSMLTLTRTNPKFSKVTMDIGTRVKELVSFDIFLLSEKAAYSAIEYRIKFAKTERNRLVVLQKALEDLGFQGADWSEATTIAIGALLLELFAEVTGYITIDTKILRKQKIKTVSATEAARSWLEDTELKEALMTPFHYCMLVPPLPWSTVHNGGYYNKQLHGLDLVWSKNGKANRGLEGHDMPDIYNAVNTLQATPWRINKKLQAVFVHLFDTKQAVAGLPRHTQATLPAKPWPSEFKQEQVTAWIAENTTAFENWKRITSETHVDNNKAKAKLYSAGQQRTLSEKFKEELAIYFVYGIDFRGRIYSAASGEINPQTNDAGKALIEFACGQPVGSTGGFWLGVHVANSFGEDKLSLEDRVAWVVDNTPLIESYAADPIANIGWHKADKPFAFLAACFEWSGFMKEGDSYISHLPVGIDGASNGLQHFGAIMRDEATCKAVDVVPTGLSTPADLYTKVAKRTLELLKDVDDELATEWSSRLLREITKHPCMTTVYSVSKRGIQLQIKEAINKLVDKCLIEPFTVSKSEAANFLSTYIIQAISEVVGAARVAMDWLAHVATVCSDDEKPVIWTTPSGLRVTQLYKKTIGQSVNLVYGGQRVRVQLSVETVKVNKAKAKAGISANFIHSMDATHETTVVNVCEANFIDTLAMVHDSFGTHCGSVEMLSLITRQTFAEQYSGNVLNDLYLEVLPQLSPEAQLLLKPPPEQGTQDIDAVLLSEFFFA